MEPKEFYRNLSLASLVAIAALGGLHFFSAFQKHWAVSALSLALFIGLSVALFYAGRAAAQSSNRLAFNNLITASVLGKIVASLVALFAYFKTQKPDDRLFVVPFLIVYVIFTAFETDFLLKLAKLKPK